MSRIYPHPGNLPAPAVNAPVRSGASIIAILCALGSFYMTGHGRELLGFVLAIVAMPAGLIGGIKALSPRVRGGILSIAAVGLGVIALLFAVLHALL
jgi:hypothetical protein